MRERIPALRWVFGDQDVSAVGADPIRTACIGDALTFHLAVCQVSGGFCANSELLS